VDVVVGVPDRDPGVLIEPQPLRKHLRGISPLRIREPAVVGGGGGS